MLRWSTALNVGTISSGDDDNVAFISLHIFKIPDEKRFRCVGFKLG